MKSLEQLREAYPGHNVADLHIHTTEYDGLLTPQQVVDEAVKRGVNVIAVTEHDSTKAGLEAERYAQEAGKPILVIPGVEVSTKQGHMLGIGVRKNIPRGMSAEDTIRAIHEQGDNEQAVAVVAHPTHRWAHSLSEKKILTLAQDPDPNARFDAIEAATPWHREVPLFKTPDRSKRFYEKHGGDVLGAAVVSSDAHGRALAKGVTLFPQEVTLFEAIRQRKTQGEVTTVIDEKSHLETMQFFGLCVYWWLVREPKQHFESYLRETQKRWSYNVAEF